MYSIYKNKDYELHKLDGAIHYYNYFKDLVNDCIEDINDIALNSVSDEARLKATEFLINNMVGNKTSVK